MRRGVTVIVFARSPQAGRVKTRLIGALGAWGAAQLHARFVRRAIRTAREARCGPVELHTTSPSSPALARLHPLHRRVPRYRQRGRDLGERMRNALAAALRRAHAAILIGTDAPDLHARDLRDAARALRGGHRAVLTPTEDGGYCLIGVRRVQSALFAGIEWGSDQVFAQTVQRLNALGWRWRPLRELWDVDRPEDVSRLHGLRRRFF